METLKKRLASGYYYEGSKVIRRNDFNTDLVSALGVVGHPKCNVFIEVACDLAGHDSDLDLVAETAERIVRLIR